MKKQNNDFKSIKREQKGRIQPITNFFFFSTSKKKKK